MSVNLNGVIFVNCVVFFIHRSFFTHTAHRLTLNSLLNIYIGVMRKDRQDKDIKFRHGVWHAMMYFWYMCDMHVV